MKIGSLTHLLASRAAWAAISRWSFKLWAWNRAAAYNIVRHARVGGQRRFKGS